MVTITVKYQGLEVERQIPMTAIVRMVLVLIQALS